MITMTAHLASHNGNGIERSNYQLTVVDKNDDDDDVFDSAGEGRSTVGETTSKVYPRSTPSTGNPQMSSTFGEPTTFRPSYSTPSQVINLREKSLKILDGDTSAAACRRNSLSLTSRSTSDLLSAAIQRRSSVSTLSSSSTGLNTQQPSSSSDPRRLQFMTGRRSMSMMSLTTSTSSPSLHVESTVETMERERREALSRKLVTLRQSVERRMTSSSSSDVRRLSPPEVVRPAGTMPLVSNRRPLSWSGLTTSTVGLRTQRTALIGVGQQQGGSGASGPMSPRLVSVNSEPSDINSCTTNTAVSTSGGNQASLGPVRVHWSQNSINEQSNAFCSRPRSSNTRRSRPPESLAEFSRTTNNSVVEATSTASMNALGRDYYAEKTTKELETIEEKSPSVVEMKPSPISLLLPPPNLPPPPPPTSIPDDVIPEVQDVLKSDKNADDVQIGVAVNRETGECDCNPLKLTSSFNFQPETTQKLSSSMNMQQGLPQSLSCDQRSGDCVEIKLSTNSTNSPASSSTFEELSRPAVEETNFKHAVNIITDKTSELTLSESDAEGRNAVQQEPVKNIAGESTGLGSVNVVSSASFVVAQFPQPPSPQPPSFNGNHSKLIYLNEPGTTTSLQVNGRCVDLHDGGPIGNSYNSSDEVNEVNRLDKVELFNTEDQAEEDGDDDEIQQLADCNSSVIKDRTIWQDLNGYRYEIIEFAIEKKSPGIGFCIDGGNMQRGYRNPISIKRMFKGDTWAKGILQAGDEIVNINGVTLIAMSHYQAWDYLKSIPDGSVEITIRRKLREQLD